MGFANSERNKETIWARLNTKTGQFVVRHKGPGEGITARKTENDTISYESYFQGINNVHVSGMRIVEDEYKGQPNKYVELRLTESGSPDIRVQANLASGVTAKLVGLLNAANLQEPLNLKLYLAKAGSRFNGDGGKEVVLENDILSINAYTTGENGSRIQPFYGADPKTGEALALPKTVMVKVGNKEVADSSAREALVATLLEPLKAKIDAARKSGQVSTHSDGASVEHEPAGSDEFDVGDAVGAGHSARRDDDEAEHAETASARMK